ncbi:MAG: fructose-1,6-bisphosphatase [Angelakisella sp.]|jgi:fructose-1,6-bisphosphatase-3|nr:fructose-1,6-bisphosphatase [Angelakisella sp.]
MTEFAHTPAPEQLKYLQLLAQSYPNIQAASTEIINLRAILNLPKGTEHFISDVHGEYECFTHILRNASGSIRRKIDESFGEELSPEQKNLLATLIYYPERKLAELRRARKLTPEWYRDILYQLVTVCRAATSKYTRSKVRKALPADFQYIIDELINTDERNPNRQEYFERIVDTIIEIERAEAFVIALCRLTQRMIIDKLHIIGDIFDRGSGAALILDDLCKHHNVDIQWGNHDVLWMGAAAGQLCCIANVIRNCVRYDNLDTLEESYGINVRPLAVFAMEQYGTDPCSSFFPRHMAEEGFVPNAHDDMQIAKIHKAITIIQLKLEGQTILAHPEYEMENRLLLDKIDLRRRTVTIDGVQYPMNDCYFPTITPETPYSLTFAEQELMERLQLSFLHSEKLQTHMNFLFKHGGMYKVYNGNLLYHGCIPMKPDGSFAALEVEGCSYRGKALMDFSDKLCRQGAYGKAGSKEQQDGLDFMWFLWCGPKSPLNGKNKMTTFERYFIDDKATWTETKDIYYQLSDDPEAAKRILAEFGITIDRARIINGHVPVKIRKGESPVKAGGKVLIIDGGISKAYQAVTGIAGYTLVSNSHQLFLSEHHPFSGIDSIINQNSDMHSNMVPVDTYPERIKICDTDEGKIIQGKIDDLLLLLQAYRQGVVNQNS